MSYYRLSWGAAEVFYLSQEEIDRRQLTIGDLELEDTEPGWYWASGQPGCLWDGDPFGPFPTEAEALEDAKSNFEDVEDEADDA